jgi:iron complex transport system substrate-binding protein
VEKFSKACMHLFPNKTRSLPYRITYLLYLGWWLLLFSCGETKTENLLKKSVPLDFATGFQLFQGEGFWEIEVSQGYAGSSDTYRYLVLDSGVQVNSNGYDAVVQLPIDAVVLTSTTQVPHLDALGQSDLLVGFPQTDLISSSSARARIAAGKVKELGAGPSANPELVLELQPDWIMISTLGEDLRYLDIFNQAGIPALINGEYVEQNPLGRAEWIKFTGVLLGKYPEALAQFEQIKKDYLEAEVLASSIPEKNKPKVLSGVMYQDIWYAPGGESWAAQLLEKAGGSYVFGKEGAAGSLQLNYEVVLDQGTAAPLWIGAADFASLEEMGKIEPRYQAFAAWKTGEVYTYTAKKGATGGLEYFELGYLRPDLILKDLIKILHPELLPGYEPYFYQKLKK